MSKVVEFKPRPRDDLVWVCNCGCTTHYHRDNGAVECGACGNIASVSGDGWRVKMPEPALGEDRDLGPEHFKIADLGDAANWLKRQAKEAGDLRACVAIFADGSLSTWRDVPEEQRPWLVERLQEAIKRLQ